jgi:arsenate reductase-like glutaredoxin family protein
VIEKFKSLQIQIEELKKESAQKDDIISFYKGNETEFSQILRKKNAEISRLTVENSKIKEELNNLKGKICNE